jgi:hypothetical protein
LELDSFEFWRNDLARYTGVLNTIEESKQENPRYFLLLLYQFFVFLALSGFLLIKLLGLARMAKDS